MIAEIKARNLFNLFIWGFFPLFNACIIGGGDDGSDDPILPKVYTSGPQGLHWNIQGPGVVEPAYLFGTIHEICADDFFTPPTLEQAVQGVQRLVFELDLDDTLSLNRALEASEPEPGYSLKLLFTEAEYQEVKTYFMNEFAINLESLDRLPPSRLRPPGADCPLQEITSYEEYLHGNYRANHPIPDVQGLETWAFQLESLVGDDYEEEARQLLEIIRNYRDYKNFYQFLLETYRNQSQDTLYSISTLGEDAGEVEMMLHARNRKWIPLMLTHMQQASTFFAVGAGHLGGAQGVIALLRAQGLQLTPVALQVQGSLALKKKSPGVAIFSAEPWLFIKGLDHPHGEGRSPMGSSL